MKGFTNSGFSKMPGAFWQHDFAARVFNCQNTCCLQYKKYLRAMGFYVCVLKQISKKIIKNYQL